MLAVFFIALSSIADRPSPQSPQSGDGPLALIPIGVVVALILTVLWSLLDVPPLTNFMFMLLGMIVFTMLLGFLLYLTVRLVVRTELDHRGRNGRGG